MTDPVELCVDLLAAERALADDAADIFTSPIIKAAVANYPVVQEWLARYREARQQ